MVVSKADLLLYPKSSRQKINNLNRQRARQMEQRLSRYFGGNRTPGSGAFWVKADINVPLPNNSGAFLIECKTSAERHPAYGATQRINLSWFEKIQREAIAMRSRFGVLIIHYQQFGGDFVFLRVEDIPIVESITGKTLSFSGATIDARYRRNGERRAGYNLSRISLLTAFSSAPKEEYRHCFFQTHFDKHIVLSAVDFKDILG